MQICCKLEYLSQIGFEGVLVMSEVLLAHCEIQESLKLCLRMIVFLEAFTSKNLRPLSENPDLANAHENHLRLMGG